MLEVKENWKIANDRDAEWLIDKVNEELIEKARFKESIINKIELLQDKLKKVEEEEQYLIERRNSYLIEYFESIPDKFKKKTKTQEKYRLPSGSIIKKYPQPEFKRNNDELLNWIKANNMKEYIEIKEAPKWGELKKITKVINGQVVTEDGEIVEGVEVIEREPTIEFREE